MLCMQIQMIQRTADATGICGYVGRNRFVEGSADAGFSDALFIEGRRQIQDAKKFENGEMEWKKC